MDRRRSPTGDRKRRARVSGPTSLDSEHVRRPGMTAEGQLVGSSATDHSWHAVATNADLDVSMAIANQQHLLPPTALLPRPVTAPVLTAPASTAGSVPATVRSTSVVDSEPSSSASTSHALAQPNSAPAALQRLRAGVIGRTTTFQSPFGHRVLMHADDASSGRPLQPLEDYIACNVHPWLLSSAHSHTGHHSKLTRGFLRDARESIAAFAGAKRDEYAVIFAGSSAAAATGKMAQMLGVLDTTMAAHKPVIIHCTTEDPHIAAVWREVDCQHVVVPTDGNGQPDLRSVRDALIMHATSPLVVGCFSLGCPLTGVVADVRALCRLLHEYGAVATFDFTNVGATMPVPCVPPGGPDPSGCVDAVVLSPNQLPGGAGSAGVLVIRRSAIQVAVPEGAGWCDPDDVPLSSASDGRVHVVDNFIADIEQHEGGEVDNMMGIIRAGISVQLHSDMRPHAMHAITREYTGRALSAWRNVPGLWLLGESQGGFSAEERLPCLSFNVLVRRVDPQTGSTEPGCFMLHHRFVSTILNDVYGIQVSVGNAFDGPNGFEHIHETLVNVCGHSRDALEHPVACGMGWVQPGWVQVRFSHLMTSREVDFIIRAVIEVGQEGWKLLPQYDCSVSCGQFTHCSESRVQQPNTMHKATQQILSAGPPRSPPAPVDAQPESPSATLPLDDNPSDMSNTFCISFASPPSSTPRKPSLASLFHGLLCRSGSWHSQSSSRSLGTSRCENDSRTHDASLVSTSAMSLTNDGSAVHGASLHSKRASGGDASGLEHSRMGLCEPRLMHVQPDRFVLEGGTSDTAWERDMQGDSTVYVYWAHCPFRWFLLPHEAANAVRTHTSLAL